MENHHGEKFILMLKTNILPFDGNPINQWMVLTFSTRYTWELTCGLFSFVPASFFLFYLSSL